MRYIILIIVLCISFSGCVNTHPLPPDDVEPVEPKPIVDVAPSPPPPSELPPLSIGVPSSVFESIRAVLSSNDSGIKFVGESPLTFVRPEGTLTIPVGSQMFWETSEKSILFKFLDPKPDVQAKVWIAKVNPHLVAIRVYADDSVQADVKGKLYSKTLTYKLAEIGTHDNPGSAAAISSLPVIYGYECSTACTLESKRQAAQAKADFILMAEDLDFTVEWQSDLAPSWMPAKRPAFWIPVSGDRPVSDGTLQRFSTGYTTLAAFADMVKATRQLNAAGAAVPAASKKNNDQTARPDRDSMRAVARNSVKYHSGHDCPNCGKYQYNIANNNGPVANSHIHRCNHCDTSWYHMDQVSSRGSSGSNGNSFFGIRWK